MDKRFRNTARNLLVALAIIALFTYLVGWREILQVLLSTDPWFVFMGFVAGITATLARGVTWKIILDRFGFDYGFSELFKIYYSGALANNVTPLGQLGGEPFVAYILSKTSTDAYEKHFGAIFSSDIINSVPFYSFSLVGLVFLLLQYPSNPVISLLSAVVLSVVLVIVGFLVMTWYMKGAVKKFARFVERAVKFVIGFVTGGERFGAAESEVGDRIDKFYDTVEFGFSHKREVAEGLIVSHAARLLDVVAVYAFVLAAGLKPSFIAIMFVVPISSLAFYIPLPGGLGSLDVALAGLLVIIADIPISIASAAVILYRLSTYGFIVLVGGLSALSIVKEAYGEDEKIDEIIEEDFIDV